MKLFTTAAFMLLAIMAVAQPPEGPVTPGSAYGAKIKKGAGIPVENLASSIGTAPKKQVRIQGVVTDVCVKQGCWLKVQNGNQKLMVKSKDHAWFVPASLVGKTVVIEGDAEQVVTPVSELRHYAEDAGKSKKEIEAITQPKKEITVQATGLVVIK